MSYKHARAVAAYGDSTTLPPKSGITDLWENVATSYPTLADFTTANTSGEFADVADGEQFFVGGSTQRQTRFD